MPSTDINIGDHSLQSLGSINIQASGPALTLNACGESSDLLLNGSATANLQSGSAILNLTAGTGPSGNATLLSGETGSVKIASGVPDVGAAILMEPEMITISVGAPGAGASIKLTPESITFAVGEITFTMTPGGIVEDVMECSRELTPEGHNFTAAETELNVGVAGQTGEAPTSESEVEAGAVVNATLCDQTIDAAMTVEAATMMVM